MLVKLKTLLSHLPFFGYELKYKVEVLHFLHFDVLMLQNSPEIFIVTFKC